ncbi:hypothetical protein FRC11_009176 [Ceratobasidium sp. 423]|nr:hypothetical protein FRC11_009176 [Ceratobasidium sp. 423]
MDLSGFSKLAPDTSMTADDRRKCKKKAQNAKKGLPIEVVIPLASHAPTDRVTRGKQYAYSNNGVSIVKSRAPMQQPTKAPGSRSRVPRTKGQEDIPDTDSEQEFDMVQVAISQSDTQSPNQGSSLLAQKPSNVQDSEDADGQSDTETILEDPNGESSSEEQYDDDGDDDTSDLPQGFDSNTMSSQNGAIIDGMHNEPTEHTPPIPQVTVGDPNVSALSCPRSRNHVFPHVVSTTQLLLVATLRVSDFATSTVPTLPIPTTRGLHLVAFPMEPTHVTIFVMPRRTRWPYLSIDIPVTQARLLVTNGAAIGCNPLAQAPGIPFRVVSPARASYFEGYASFEPHAHPFRSAGFSETWGTNQLLMEDFSLLNMPPMPVDLNYHFQPPPFPSSATIQTYNDMFGFGAYSFTADMQDPRFTPVTNTNCLGPAAGAFLIVDQAMGAPTASASSLQIRGGSTGETNTHDFLGNIGLGAPVEPTDSGTNKPEGSAPTPRAPVRRSVTAISHSTTLIGSSIARSAGTASTSRDSTPVHALAPTPCRAPMSPLVLTPLHNLTPWRNSTSLRISTQPWDILPQPVPRAPFRSARSIGALGSSTDRVSGPLVVPRSGLTPTPDTRSSTPCPPRGRLFGPQPSSTNPRRRSASPASSRRSFTNRSRTLIHAHSPSLNHNTHPLTDAFDEGGSAGEHGPAQATSANEGEEQRQEEHWDGGNELEGARMDQDDPENLVVPIGAVPPDVLNQRIEFLGDPDAPSSTEFGINRSQTIRELCDARKSKVLDDSEEVELKGRKSKRLGYFSKQIQGILGVMKSHLQWSMLTRAPWSQSKRSLTAKTVEFVKAKTTLEWPEDEDLAEDMKNKVYDEAAKLRSGPQKELRDHVMHYFNLELGDATPVARLLENHRCFYPNDEMHPNDMFNFELLSSGLRLLVFRNTKPIGPLFLDEILGEDDVEATNTLLSLCALPGNPPLTIEDTSCDARRGAPIAAIAFVCIQIYHALERIRAPKKAPEFKESNYNKLWMYYVRELVSHPHLGQIRRATLNALKEGYIQNFPRLGKRVGEDYLW